MLSLLFAAQVVAQATPAVTAALRGDRARSPYQSLYARGDRANLPVFPANTPQLVVSISKRGDRSTVYAFTPPNRQDRVVPVTAPLAPVLTFPLLLNSARVVRPPAVAPWTMPAPVPGSGWVIPDPIYGTGSESLPAPTIDSTGALVFAATGAESSVAPTLDGTGTMVAVFSGTGSVTSPAVTLAATGGETFAGSGAEASQAITLASTGSVTFAGVGLETAPAASFSGSVYVQPISDGPASVTAPGVELNGTADVEFALATTAFSDRLAFTAEVASDFYMTTVSDSVTAGVVVSDLNSCKVEVADGNG